MKGEGERATTITISDEEHPEEGSTKDKDEQRLKEAGVEQTVVTEREKLADMEVTGE